MVGAFGFNVNSVSVKYQHYCTLRDEILIISTHLKTISFSEMTLSSVSEVFELSRDLR